MLQLTSSQLSSSFWPKNQLLKQNTHLFPVIWLRMTYGYFEKNKVCLKGTQILGYWKHPKKMWRRRWKLFHTGFQKCFQHWQTASLGQLHSCSRGALRRWPLSVSCKYTGMRLAIKVFRELNYHTSYIENFGLTSLYFWHAELCFLVAFAALEQVPGWELWEETLLTLLNNRNLSISLAIHETLTFVVVPHDASNLEQERKKK